MLSRRQFLRRASLVSLYPLVPSMLGRIAQAAGSQPDARVLVVLQLDGGNDGINTVVPFGDDGYARHRDNLRLATNDLHRLSDHVGLHHEMEGMKHLFDDGRLTIVQGVGYPNPNRSHFQSMRIWQTACIEEGNESSYGWLGRSLDREGGKTPTGGGAFYIGDEQTPIALWGRRSQATSLSSLDDLILPPEVCGALRPGVARSSDDSLQRFVTQQVLSAYTSADQFDRQRRGANFRTARYPSTKLGQHLQLISQLMQSGAGARVFYTSQSGYDTHAAQLYTHSQLLRELSDALRAFLDDLESTGLGDRVVVLAFSEFGRRVEENASQGTDHGAAGPVFLAGRQTSGGLVGKTPDLTDLQEGDVKMSVDFREVYAAVLEDWLGVDAAKILVGSFTKVPLFRS
jgi:uncharacterized protein (DUF1501 family)